MDGDIAAGPAGLVAPNGNDADDGQWDQDDQQYAGGDVHHSKEFRPGDRLRDIVSGGQQIYTPGGISMESGKVCQTPHPVEQGCDVFNGYLPKEKGCDDQRDNQADSSHCPVIA